jgi:hypothetical protein
MAAHTPGPLTVVKYEHAVGPSHGVKTVSPGGSAGTWVATMHPRSGPEESEANARLIAAAPDLLRELRMLVLQCSCGSHPDGEIAGACGRCAAAIDAINKAEGR